MKKIVWLASALLLAFSLCVSGLLKLQIVHASPYTSIDVDTAYNMITNGSYPDLVVLDVRRQDEYDSGHIYGAVWIPVSELDGRIGELAGHENHEIIVYCRSGGRSATASGILDSHGFTKVYNMLGGILAWQSAGYPVWIATVHNLNTTFNYDTIQAAIDAAQTLDGHEILVDARIYYENIVLHKSLSLVGENASTTIIDGNGVGSVINATVGNANISFFTIRNSGVDIHDSGIYANSSNDHNINNNIITNNNYGIYLEFSSNNTIFHNTFVNNTYHVHVNSVLDSTWDDGYPSGGNYWSDYDSADLYSGPYQNESGSDGIGDTPYIIHEDNQDNYPLMSPYEYWSNPIQGDINRDMKVGNEDLFQLNAAYGSTPEKPYWNPHADLNTDDLVNCKDLFMLGTNYGKEGIYP